MKLEKIKESMEKTTGLIMGWREDAKASVQHNDTSHVPSAFHAAACAYSLGPRPEPPGSSILPAVTHLS
jgi:hypothetical protein